jgi:hypothetical protein
MGSGNDEEVAHALGTDMRTSVVTARSLAKQIGVTL